MRLSYLSSSQSIFASLLIVFLTGCSGEAKSDLGVLTELLGVGQDGAWYSSFEPDGYWLENQQDTGAIRYYYGNYNNEDAGSRQVSVDVTLADAAASSRAGLVYGFDSQGNYYLVMLGPAGEVSTFRRDQNGVREVMSSSRTTSAATQELTLRENGSEIEIFVDGESMGSMQAAGTGRGAIGIAAMGIGRFGFNNYRSNEAVSQTSAATASVNLVQEAPSSGMANQPAQTKDMSKRTIRDEFGFEQPIDAYSLLLPADWRLKGSVQWHGVAECPLELAKVHFMATAPDGNERIESIPGGAWSWMSLYDAMPQMKQQQSLGCPIKRILDMPSFMQAYIPSIRPNAKQISAKARPDLVQQILEHADGLTNDPYRQFSIQVQEVEISYEADGKTINELLISTVLFSQSPGADPYGGMTGSILMAQGMGTISIANVNSPPNRELLEEVGSSLAMLPVYQNRLQQFVNQRSQMMAQAYQRRRAAQQQYLASRRAAAASARNNFKVDTSGSDILDIQFKGWQSRDRMTSAGQSRAVDGVLDRTSFNNNQGQIVYMPTTHSRMYQLPNDVYVGTNDQFFNPIQVTGEFGSELGEHQYGW